MIGVTPYEYDMATMRKFMFLLTLFAIEGECS